MAPESDSPSEFVYQTIFNGTLDEAGAEPQMENLEQAASPPPEYGMISSNIVRPILATNGLSTAHQGLYVINLMCCYSTLNYSLQRKMPTAM